MKNFSTHLTPQRLVVGSGSLVVLSSLLWGAIASLPTSGVTLNDSPPAVPCSTAPCTYDPLSYSTARFYGPASSGSAANQEMGTTLAVGDFDGDGITDYAFGAPKLPTSRGAVYVYYGTSASGVTSSIDLGSGITIYGRTASPNFLGSALAAGDITGDGKVDLIIGAPSTSATASVVYILPGSSTRWSSLTGATGIEAFSGLIKLETGANGSELGYSLAVGDVGAATGKPDPSSDGRLDLLIGAPGAAANKGAAYLLYGPISSSIADVSSSSSGFTFNGGSNGDRVGGSVAIYGSLTESTSQNGLPDLAIGAFDASSSNGKLYLIEGRARDYFTQAFGGSSGGLDTAGIFRKRTIVGDLTGAQAGYAISGLGDVNGDGFNDLAFSAPKAAGPAAEPERGRVFILFGSGTALDAGSANLSTLTTLPWFYGDTNYDRLGVSISKVGDGDGDAYSDFVIGSRYDTDSTSFFGAAYLTRGRVAANWSFSSAKIDGVRFTGPRASDEAGKAVLGIGDVDGDGYDDFLIGAPGSDASSGQSDNKGRIYLISPGDYLDRDSDTQDRAAGDCDDLDNSRRYRSDGTETCDGKDNDCDGLVDGNDTSLTGTAYYTDADGDGYGSKTSPATQGCTSSPPAGKVTNNTDCDDTNAAIKPGATETCDSKDNDCDSLIDDDDSPVSNQTTWYRDADNDTYGDSTVSTAKCTKPSGFVAVNGDCNDSDSTVNPSKTEVCNSKDDDCDTLIDDQDPTVSNQTTYYFDGDSDGYGRSSPTSKTCGSAPAGYAAQSGDCDDVNAQVKPNATETCNGIDDDCDTKIDAADSPVTGTLNYYPDADLDTYGSSSVAAQAACAQNPPSGKVTSNTDCNDNDATVNPSKTEVCNSKDDDCDGSTDDNDTSVTGQSTWYQDSDADSYGNAAVSQKACNKPANYVSDNTDCNDTNAAIKPGAQEICDNNVDNDCDGKADDNDPSLKDGAISVTKVNTYYADSDKDGYGQDTSTVQACTQPANYSSQKGDCNDGNNSIYPGAAEGTVNNPSLDCVNGNSLDNDCDGIVDEGTCDYDDDGDKQSERDGDCNDAAPTTGKGFPELCNGIDDDCDDKTDEDYDVDLDGQLSASLCTGIALPNATDCDDSDPNIYKGATPVCDGKDTDCSKGASDPGTPDTGYSSESDTDKDGYRACGKDKCSGTACEGTEDCDDSKSTVFPGAPELCDELDNDCNNKVDDFTDNDGDGFNSCDDCDDNANTSYPSAPELCDGEDNNCDGIVPSSGISSEKDDDEDGFRVCDDDCNDSDKAMFPDNQEVCDEKDNDCNGTADDDAFDEETYYADGDADSNGDPRSTVTGCEVPPGYVINSKDCDDADASIYLDAAVQCDGLDHDCDGTADYLNEDFDADNDSFLSSTICSGLPSTYVLDCNDGNNQIYPGANEEPGDAIDNNCDGELSEGYTAVAVSGCSCSTEGQAPEGRTAAAGYGLALAALFQVWRRRSRLLAQKGEKA